MPESDKPVDGKEGYDVDRDVEWVKKTPESEELYNNFRTGKLNNELFTYLALSAYECARYRVLFPGQVLPVPFIIQQDTNEFVEANDVVGHFINTHCETLDDKDCAKYGDLISKVYHQFINFLQERGHKQKWLMKTFKDELSRRGLMRAKRTNAGETTKLRLKDNL